LFMLVCLVFDATGINVLPDQELADSSLVSTNCQPLP